MIDIRDLSVSYKTKHVLSNICFQINEGEVLGVIGPNGCGKSTLLRAIAGSIDYTGQITYRHRDTQTIKSKEWAKIVGLLPQKVELPDSFSVHDVVMSSYALHQEWWHLDNKLDRQHVDDVLEKLSIKNLRDISVNHLSGGEQQRVLLASLVAQCPEIALLDEPTNHLDLHFQIELLKQAKKNFNTIVTVLHDINLASRYCDRIMLLDQTHIIAIGKPKEVLTREKLANHFKINPITYYSGETGQSLLSYYENL